VEDAMGTEFLDKRFGVTAVEKGFITKDQLFEALRMQITEEIEKNEHRLIGRILYDMELLTLSQIEEVLDTI
jgi:hypothetical protein